jgi:N-acetyl-alpha-D-muramate 1-phosphate uridylyltransferase
MKAMLLAAGRGVRMQALTDNTSKVLLKVGGKALIDYHLEKLAKAGFQDIVINLCYQAEQVQDYLGDGQRYGLNLHFSVESERLGMGGGIVNALPLLGDGAFAVLSADIWTDYDYRQLRKPLKQQAHLIMVDNPSIHPAGDYGLANGQVLPSGKDNLTFSGMGCFTADLFRALKPGSFRIGPVLEPAIRQQQVTGEHFTGCLMNANTGNDLQLIEQQIECTQQSLINKD